MKNPTIDELYSAYACKVYAVCMSYLKNPQDAEDIMQDTFVAAMRKLHSLKNPQKAQAWLCKIAANKCKNYLKKNKPELVADESELDGDTLGNIGYAVSPEAAVIDESMRQSVRSIVDDLPDAQKAVICGFYFDCKSIKELSRQLNCKQNTVKSILHRARLSVRKECDKRGVTLNGISVGAALSSCANVIPTAAKGAAGAIATKITAGVLAAAVAAYGIIGVCIYSGRDNYSDYCDVYDGSRKISAEPLKISDVRLIGDPVDRTSEYEAVLIEEISEKLNGLIPIMFIDNDRLYASRNDEQYIYNFAANTLTPIDLTGITDDDDKRLYSTPTQLQYMSPSDYWLIFNNWKDVVSEEQYAVHFNNEKADKVIDFSQYLKHAGGGQYDYSVNTYANKLVEYSYSDNTITVTDFNGNSKVISLKYYINGRARWLNDEWIEVVCRNIKEGYELGYSERNKNYKNYIIRLNINTEQAVITDYEYKKSAETATEEQEEIQAYNSGFFPYMLSDYNGALTAYSYRLNIDGYCPIGDVAVLDNDNNTLIRYMFKHTEDLISISYSSVARGEYIYTYTHDSEKSNSLYRYNVRSEDYEKIAVFKYNEINNEIELITSPNGSRMITANRTEDLYSNKVEYYLIRKKT